MIEIRSRYEDKVLYTAQTAQDVRQALQEAVASGANLSDANLSDANLSGANLSGANLSDANLSDANLSDANLSDANLSDANLRGANLSDAYLSDANLSDANLRGANLRGANLSDANLSDANLSDANLRGAYLSGAKGYSPERTNDLRILLDQPGKVRAYKLVDSQLRSPINGKRLTYTIGETLEVPDANTDPDEDCAAGINVCTLPWALCWWQEGYRVLIVEFSAKDIACIPHATDGKFRVSKCKVVKEYDLTPMFEREAEERKAYEAEKAAAEKVAA